MAPGGATPARAPGRRRGFQTGPGISLKARKYAPHLDVQAPIEEDSPPFAGLRRQIAPHAGSVLARNRTVSVCLDIGLRHRRAFKWPLENHDLSTVRGWDDGLTRGGRFYSLGQAAPSFGYTGTTMLLPRRPLSEVSA